MRQPRVWGSRILRAYSKAYPALLFFSGIFLAFFLISESVASYFLFRRAYNGGSAVVYYIGEFRDVLRKKAKSGWKTQAPKVVSDDSWQNPFQTRYSDRFMTDDIFRIHPFIGYSNASISVDVKPRMDYFGFRNRRDLYFSERAPGTKFVVLTGGSEAAGHTHSVSIAENLEKYLNESAKGGTRYEVLNLAMNGYALSHEIGAYTHLAFNLRPDYVVSHTGWNDLINGSMIPENFKRMGLNYIKFEEYWLPRFYELKVGPRFSEYVMNDHGVEWLYKSFTSNAEKFRKIVQSNGGRLIMGIQAYDPELIDPNYATFFEKVQERYKRLVVEARAKKLLIMKDFGPYKFKDDIHTDDASSVKIAEIYGRRILNQGG